MTRPPYKPVGVRLPLDLIAAIDKTADERNCLKREVIEYAISRGLDLLESSIAGPVVRTPVKLIQVNLTRDLIASIHNAATVHQVPKREVIEYAIRRGLGTGEPEKREFTGRQEELQLGA